MKTDRELMQQALKMIRMLRYRSLTDAPDEIIAALEKRLATTPPAALAQSAERNKLAAWMQAQGYATGHGDTIEQLLEELRWQVEERGQDAP
jgi:hypothetical protein